MTAEVLSLDGARVSAREVCYICPDAATAERVFDRLRRQVQREVLRLQLPVTTARFYLTYEEIVEPPEPGAAA